MCCCVAFFSPSITNIIKSPNSFSRPNFMFFMRMTGTFPYWTFVYFWLSKSVLLLLWHWYEASSKGWRRTGEEKVCEDRRSRHLEVTHVWATHPPTGTGRLPRACSPHIWPTRVPPDPIFHWRTEITNTNTLYVVTLKKIGLTMAWSPQIHL